MSLLLLLLKQFFIEYQKLFGLFFIIVFIFGLPFLFFFIFLVLDEEIH